MKKRNIRKILSQKKNMKKKKKKDQENSEPKREYEKKQI